MFLCLVNMSGIVDNKGFSQNYNTLCEYANNLKDVANSPGYLVKNYNTVCKQIDTINNMVNNLKQAAISSIKQDLIDIMNNSVDWNRYKDELITFLKNTRTTTPSFTKPRLQSFNFDYNDCWEALDDELLQNMFLIASDISEHDKNIDKKINTYEDNKDVFVSNLDIFTNNIPTWENAVVNCRTNNIPILMANIDTLYNIHKKYIYEQYKKLPSSFEQDIDGKVLDCIVIKKKLIPLDKSQTKFIKNAIKTLLDIQ